MQVLLVEDDLSIAESVREGLERQAFTVTHTASGRAAVDLARGFDVVLLDLGLPDLDGKDVCRLVRAASNVPIIVLTARGDEIDRVVLLELGADDYLVKPFGFRELVARIGAVTRRSNSSVTADTAPSPPVTDGGPVFRASAQHLGSLTIDRDARRVYVAADMKDLTPKEYDLLAMLAENPGAARRREDIIDQVWDAHWYGPTKTLDVHISAVRRKLGHPEWITTIRGVGYRLEVPE